MDKEIQKAAEELFNDSEYPVPNIFCFTKGAKWALSHQWNRVGDKIPPGIVILLCQRMIKDDMATALCVYVRGRFMVYNGRDKITNKEFHPTHWMTIPQIQKEIS